MVTSGGTLSAFVPDGDGNLCARRAIDCNLKRVFTGQRGDDRVQLSDVLIYL